MPPSPHHVLLLGGHGKIAQLLTPLLLRRGWDVTSVIRSEEQVPTIRGLAKDVSDGGKLNVLVRSLEEVKSEGDAKRVIDEVGGDYIVWSAGEFFFFLLPKKKKEKKEYLPRGGCGCVEWDDGTSR
jgi:putative NADH-flavin reductase